MLGKINSVTIGLVILAIITTAILTNSILQEKEIVALVQKNDESIAELAVTKETLVEVADINNELNERIVKASIIEETVTTELRNVNDKLFAEKVKLIEKETRLHNIKKRLSTIALARPESLERLINAKNKTLFKRATLATTFN